MGVPSMQLLAAKAAGGGLPVGGATAWWDFSDESSITIATGISQADDLTGNGNHLVQGTGANQPAHITTALIGSSTLKVASFDGSNDLLATAADVTNTSGGWTVFAVAAKRTTTVTGSDADVLFSTNGRAVYVTSAPNLDIWRGSAASTVTGTSTFWTTANIHTRTLTTTPGYSYWINSTNYLSDVTPSSGATGVVELGAAAGGSYGDWDIGEVVVYDTALGTTDREAVITYLKDKWGTP